MGVMSRCIYVDKPDLQFDVNKLDRNVIDILSTKGFFDDYLKNNKNNIPYIMTLNDFKNNCYTSAKIYGYTYENHELCNGFYSFMLEVANQNPTCKSFEIHFYCEDEYTPYSICYSNGDVLFKTYPYQHILYFDIVQYINNSFCCKKKIKNINNSNELININFNFNCEENCDDNFIDFNFNIKKYIKFHTLINPLKVEQFIKQNNIVFLERVLTHL